MLSSLNYKKTGLYNLQAEDLFIVLFIITTIFIPSFAISGISLRLVFLLIGVIILIIRGIKINIFMGRIIFLGILFSALCSFQILINYAPSTITRRILGQYMAFPLIVLLSQRIIHKLSFYRNIFIIIGIMLFIIAFGQALNSNFFLSIPALLGNVESTEELLEGRSLFRVSGPYLFAIPFTYALSNVIPWIFLVNNKILKLLLAFAGFLVIMLTGTRSLVLGFGLGIILLSILTSSFKKILFYILIGIFLLLIVFWTLSNIFPDYYNYLLYTFTYIGKEGSSLSRIDLAKVSILASLDSPLIGRINYNKSNNLQYIIEKSNFSYILHETTAHNTFLLTLAYFGYPTAFFAFAILYKPFFLVLKKKKHIFLIDKSFAAFSLIFLVTYFINAFFHNQGPFISDNLFWINWGLVLSFSNLSNVAIRSQNAKKAQ